MFKEVRCVSHLFLVSYIFEWEQAGWAAIFPRRLQKPNNKADKQ